MYQFRINPLRSFCVASLVTFVLLSSGALSAQETGSLYGTVTDAEATPLPGVTVELRGEGAPRLIVTDELGQYRFLGLDPGNYELTASLEGFSTQEYPAVNIRIGRNTTINVQLSAAIEEVITVTSESPLLDERKLTQGTTVSRTELEKIPTSRDPWSLVTQTPGVVSDRINVGGNESGQQADFRAPGVVRDENNFMVDGVQITDMRAIGSSATYYDFDQFQEMKFQTGGSDVSQISSGVNVNLVTKRGSNDFRGSARFFVTDSEWQDTPDISASELDPGQIDPVTGEFDIAGNSIGRILDYGFEVGGPIVRDRFWAWISWGTNDIKNFASSGGSDDSILENSAIKLNGQLSERNSLVASMNNGDKLKFGREAGPTRPDETTWNQRGPSAVYKFEDTHVVSANFYLTGNYSKVDAGFALAARGGRGPSAPESFRTSDGVWHDNYLSGNASGPAETYKIDGSYFFNTGSVSNELKFGVRDREYSSQSTFRWPGRNIFTFGTAPGTGFVGARRGFATPTVLDYQSLYAQDTFTVGNLTVNAGLRYDKQDGVNEAASIDANPEFPNILPAISFGGNSGGFEWETISPRFGLTYALGAERKTLLRATLAQFPDQLQASDVNRLNPAGTAYAYFSWTDQNGNDRYDTGEPVSELLSFANGYDPANRTSLVDPDRTDPGLDPPVTSELVLGIEHSFLPEFVAGANVTLRNVTDVTEERSLVSTDGGATFRPERASDYVQVACGATDAIPGTLPCDGTFPDGSSFSVPVFGLAPGVTTSGGGFLANGDRERDYLGASVNFTKRLSNRWMARGYFQWGKAEWDVPASYLANTDPNRSTGDSESHDPLGSDIDGGTFIAQSGGSGKDNAFLQSTWAANLNGMYQVAPEKVWGFNVAANLYWREGSVVPFILEGAGGEGQDVFVSPQTDSFRNEDIFTTDLRIEKDIAATNNVGLTLSADLFNVFNESYVLQREINLDDSRGNFAEETLSPRIVRVGVRISWR